MSREKIANEILPGLWLGAVEAVESISFLKTNHIEVVISLMGEKPLVAEGWGRKGEHIYFEIEDAPDCDLLSIFPGAIKEIKLAQKHRRGCLVHCAMGMSRSATVVLAYLCSQKNLTFHEAVELVSSKRPQIAPNKGFVEQLHMFRDMGWKVDETNDIYRFHLGNCLLGRLKEMNTICELEEEHYGSSLTLPPSTPSSPSYLCTKCLGNKKSTPLFSQNKVIHSCHQHVYILPSSPFFFASCEALRDSLHCPECNGEVGRFDWSHSSSFAFGMMGSQKKMCGCGKYSFTTLFCIQKGRVKIEYE